MKPILTDMSAFSEELRELSNKAGKLAGEHGRDYSDWFNYYLAQLSAQKGYKKATRAPEICKMIDRAKEEGAQAERNKWALAIEAYNKENKPIKVVELSKKLKEQGVEI